MDMKDFAVDILKAMPESKKSMLRKALQRNWDFTSTYTLEFGKIHVYKEGFYLELLGTRTSFKVWADDNDGEFVFRRKPNENKLNKIYDEDIHFDYSDYIGI